jgi:hypothetical protein
MGVMNLRAICPNCGGKIHWSAPASPDTLIYPRFFGVAVLESGGLLGRVV